MFREESEKTLNKMSELQVHALKRTGKWEKSKFEPNKEFLELRKNQILECIQQIEVVLKLYQEKIHKIEKDDLNDLEDLSNETKEPPLKLDSYLQDIQEINKDSEERISSMIIESDIAKDRLNAVNDEIQKQDLILENHISRVEDVNNKMELKETESNPGCFIQ